MDDLQLNKLAEQLEEVGSISLLKAAPCMSFAVSTLFRAFLVDFLL